MRNIIAAMQISLDGYIEGPDGELDWIENWEDSYGLMAQVDTCILGAGMYPGYEQYWTAVLAEPGAPLPFSGKVATQGEVDYANFARHTPHVVLSTSLQSATWDNTCIVRDVEQIRRLKQQPGKDMYAVGGAALVSSLIEAELIDELRLAIHPIVLGRGNLLFKDIARRHALELIHTRQLPWGTVEMSYRFKVAS
ncbi:MAG: dihydrofolate reductase family protein [Burkholderiales bacterium]